MFLLSGIFFPVENLPAGIRFLPWLTPLYHAVEIIRPLVLGQVTGAVLVHLGWLAAFVALTLRLPLVMVKNRLVQ
jgi:lipooligosaccharide transport system permease protein